MINALRVVFCGVLLGACTTTAPIDRTPLEKAFEDAKIPAAYMSAANVASGERVTVAFEYDESGDQIFRIASMTKTFTTVAALQLVEKGLISLDEPLEGRLPALADVKILGPDCDLVSPSSPVTLRHLLSHTSGFGYAFSSDELLKCGYQPEWNTSTPRVFESGSAFLYGRGVGWTGLLIEELSGLSLEEYIRQNISDPLELERTWFDVPEALQSAIQDYGIYPPDDSEDGYSDEFTAFPDRVPTESSDQYGGGNLFSSPNDYVRFLSAIVNGGELDGVRILSEDMVREMFRNQLPEGVTRDIFCYIPTFCYADNLGASEDLFGLGFALAAGPDGSATQKGYWGGIFNSYFTIDYDRKIVVVYFSQFLPYSDPRAHGLYEQFETAAYEALK